MSGAAGIATPPALVAGRAGQDRGRPSAFQQAGTPGVRVDGDDDAAERLAVVRDTTDAMVRERDGRRPARVVDRVTMPSEVLRRRRRCRPVPGLDSARAACRCVRRVAPTTTGLHGADPSHVAIHHDAGVLAGVRRQAPWSPAGCGVRGRRRAEARAVVGGAREEDARSRRRTRRPCPAPRCAIQTSLPSPQTMSGAPRDAGRASGHEPDSDVHVLRRSSCASHRRRSAAGDLVAATIASRPSRGR